MTAERIELTVRLGREGATLQRSYSYPPYGFRPELDRPASWDSFAGPPAFDGLTGAEALSTLLDRGEASELAAHLTKARLVEVGELLFALLFGEPEEWETLLRGLFKTPTGPRPNPPRHPVRVRILSDDPLLCGLPWRVTAWQGKWLLDSSWTFEVSNQEVPTNRVEVRIPCRILVLAPGWDEGVNADEHWQDLQETLVTKISRQYEDKSFLTRVEDQEELTKAWQGMEPHLFYYYGHGTVDGGQACLLLGKRGEEPKLLSMNELSRRLAPSPKLIYLNACKSGATGWQSAGHQLTPDVPCVIARRTTAWSAEAGATLTWWLEHFLALRLDPVAALHLLPPGESTRDFEWATPVVWTSFKTWDTHREITPIPHSEPGLRLDRDEQRAMAFKHVAELRESRTRRVEAMVVYGAPGALVERFAEQARHHLESGGVCLKWLWPPASGVSFENLEGVFELWLEKDDFESTQGLLRRLAPDRAHTDKSPVLCLDWGLVRIAQQPGFMTQGLVKWLEFSAGHLSHQCPADIRVVTFLALEAEKDEHERIGDAMEELKIDIRSEQFRFGPLPPLATVKLTHVLDYLEDPSNNTRCHDPKAASRLIHRRTGGHYAETVRLIDKGQQGGWYPLLRELREEQGAKPESPKGRVSDAP